MKSSRFGLLAFVLLLSGGGAARAQDPAGQFGERVEVEVVNVDVVVVDEQGNRVTDLGRGDFVLEVDRKPVSIDYFATPAATRKPAPAAAPAAGAAGDAVDMSSANLFVFVDQSALEWRASNQILDEIKAFVLPRTGGRERIMIAAFAQNLRILSPPTSERTRIDEAFGDLEKLRASGSLVAAERYRLERDVREIGKPRAQVQITDESGAVSPEQGVREATQEANETDMLRAEIEQFGEEQIDRQSRAVAALREWIGGLAAIEGRKSVLFASAGYTAQPEAYLQTFLDQKRTKIAPDKSGPGRLVTSGLDLLKDFEAAVRAAQNARVAFYTISPRETPVQAGGAEFASAGVNATAMAPRDPSIAEAASSLQRLAVSTGGSSLFLDDDLSDRLVTVSDDAAASYSLGFTVDEKAGEGDHQILVRTNRPGLSVRHRESYRRTTLAERSEAALVAAATLDTTVNPLGLRLELGEPTKVEKRSKEVLVPILVRIPLGLVTLTPEGDPRSARLTARVAVLNESRHVRFGESAPIAISIPAADLEKALGSYWAYRAEAMVGPGSQRVAVMIADELGGILSTATASVDVAKKAK